MLADALPVELSRHAGELDLAMQRLVGDAQQRSIGHAKAEAVGGNGGRFHVERDGAGLRQAADDRRIVAELPVAVVDARDRAGAHHDLELEAARPGDLPDRLLERHLHLGQRRHRHPDRQFLVKHVVLAHVAVRQHVIAELLRVAQPRAMAEHQPGMGTQHRDMIGDVARVRRTGADVDHRDAARIRTDQVERRHLRQALRRRAHGRGIAQPRVAGDDVTRLDEGIAVGSAERHALAADARERIDVELIVGEDHEILEMLGVGAGVVVEPVQRVIDSGGLKQRERPGRGRGQGAVDDRVVHVGEIGRVEEVAQRPVAKGGARGDVDVAPIGEVNRDRLIRLADLHRHAVVPDEEANLLCEVVAEQIGPRHRRLVHARTRNETIGEARIQPRMGGRGQADEGIGGANALLERRAFHIRFQATAQEGGVALIDLGEAGDRRGGIFESLRFDPLG